MLSSLIKSTHLCLLSPHTRPTLATTQPYNLTTSLIPASFYRSQTLQPHEAPHGLRTSPTSPFRPNSRQPTILFFKAIQLPISLPHHNSQYFPVQCFHCSCSVVSNTVSKQEHLSPPSYKITLFHHPSLPLFSKNLLFLLPFLNISSPLCYICLTAMSHIYTSLTFQSLPHIFQFLILLVIPRYIPLQEHSRNTYLIIHSIP